MSWLDTLRDRGMQAKRDAQPAEQPAIARPVTPRQPKPEIKVVYITTRPPQGDGDPGEAAQGFYSVVNDVVIMCDQKGKPTGKQQRIGPGDSAHMIAGRLTRAVWLKAGGESNFNRPLHYPKIGCA